MHRLPPRLLLLHPKPQGLTGLVLLFMLWGMYPARGSTPQHLHPRLLWCPGSQHGAPNLPPGKPCSARVICPRPWFQPLPTLSLMPGEALLVLPFRKCLVALLPPAFYGWCWALCQHVPVCRSLGLAAGQLWLCGCCSLARAVRRPFPLLARGYSLLCSFCPCPLPAAAPFCQPSAFLLHSGSPPLSQHRLALAAGRREVFLPAWLLSPVQLARHCAFPLRSPPIPPPECRGWE